MYAAAPLTASLKPEIELRQVKLITKLESN